jgi:hypothetical protein
MFAMSETAGLTSRMSDDGGASATQLSVLLSSATSAIDEEFKRSERLDAKSRNQITIVASFFTVVQAVVVGLINGSLGGTEHHGASSFVLWLAIVGALASAALVAAVFVSYGSWKLRDDPTLETETIREYIDFARDGNPVVGVNLVAAYADIAQGRRDNNALRATALERAAKACGAATLLIAAELTLAFIAVAVQ